MHKYRLETNPPQYVEIPKNTNAKEFFDNHYPNTPYVRVEDVELFRYEDLSENAKDRVLHAHYQTEFTWNEEYRQSLRHFCEALYVPDAIKDWNIGYPGTHVTFNSDLKIRGLKLKEARQLDLSDGFCAGEGLKENFLKQWENTGDPLFAFKNAVQLFFREWENDIDDYYSEETVEREAKDLGHWFEANGDYHSSEY